MRMTTEYILVSFHNILVRAEHEKEVFLVFCIYVITSRCPPPQPSSLPITRHSSSIEPYVLCTVIIILIEQQYVPVDKETEKKLYAIRK